MKKFIHRYTIPFAWWLVRKGVEYLGRTPFGRVGAYSIFIKESRWFDIQIGNKRLQVTYTQEKGKPNGP